MMNLTIFTPTFNRAYILPILFESLRSQTVEDFEWIIVDDGSTDATERLCDDFKKIALFPIRYYKKDNGGKHRAINKGIKEAKGDLFFIVDSDDRLAPNAVEFLNSNWKEIKDDPSFCGLSGIRVNDDNSKIGSAMPRKVMDCSVTDFRFKMGVKGDMAEAWRTSLLRENPFPEIDGEKFLTEALVWNRISKDKKVRFTDEPIYICKYREDGLTTKMTKLRHENPIGCILYYSEESKLDIPFRLRLKSYINLWRFALSAKNGIKIALRSGGVRSTVGLPFGWIMRMYDLRK